MLYEVITLGVPIEAQTSHALSTEELRTVVKEAGAMIPKRHQAMLLNLMDLEKVTVEDIMVPRHDVFGIDMDADWEAIITQLSGSQYTRLPLFKENIDHVIGILHMRDVLPLLYRGELDRAALQRIAREPYFIPENTSLNRITSYNVCYTKLLRLLFQFGKISPLLILFLLEKLGFFPFPGQ